MLGAFYFGHHFSYAKGDGAMRQQVLSSSPSEEDMKRYASLAALEVAKGHENDAATLRKKIDAMSDEIAKIESRMAALPTELQGGIQKVIDRLDQGLIPRMSKGSETMLDMTETFDGEFKTLDVRFGEVAALLQSIKTKQADLDALKKFVGDGNAEIAQLSERMNRFNERQRELTAVLRTKLPNAEDIKAASFGVDFPPPPKAK